MVLVSFSCFVPLLLLSIAYADQSPSSYILIGAGISGSADCRGSSSSLQNKQTLGSLAIGDTISNDNTSSNVFDNHTGIMQVPYSGLTTRGLTPSLAETLGLDATARGDVITAIIPGSPAEMLDIRSLNLSRSGSADEVMASRGDIIVTVDGSSSFTTGYRTIEEYIVDNKKVDDNITLGILRDGQLNDIEMTLASKPTYLWYENTNEGIGLKYPSDWMFVEEENLAEELVVQFHSPEKALLTGLPVVNASVSKYPSTNNGNSKSLDSNINNNIKIFRILGIDITRLGKSPAYSVIYYDYSQNNNTQKVLTIFTERDSDLFSLNFSINPSKYDDYLPLFREMIKSFQFI
jgi:hypothetical protein